LVVKVEGGKFMEKVCFGVNMVKILCTHEYQWKNDIY
jgi:hypothetical protein